MALSWTPNLLVDNSGTWTPGLDLAFGIYESDASTTDVIFLLTPDACTVSIELFTEQARHVLPNASPIGDIRFSVWTLEGPNVDTDLEVIIDGGPDAWVSWAIAYGQIPVTGLTVTVDEDVEALSSYDLDGTTSGPVIACVASLDATTDPTITYPGDRATLGRNYSHGGDAITGDLRIFASDLPGTFEISSTTMRRVVLLEAAAAPTGGWRVGRVGWPAGGST